MLSFLFPPICPLCAKELLDKGEHICKSCSKKQIFIKEPTCYSCGKPMKNHEKEYCSDCRQHPKNFERGMGLCIYQKPVTNSLAAIKYKNERKFAKYYLEEIQKRKYRDLLQLKIDVIIPVPIHRKKRRKRGFNQAEEFGKRLSHYLEIPMNSSLLIRSKKTVPQKDLGPALRLKNLEQAFSCRKLPDRMKKILLIDDIYTTGSTAEACSRALKKAGAEQVFLLVIATSSNR